MEISPRRRKRFRANVRRQEARWAAKSSPVTVRQVDTQVEPPLPETVTKTMTSGTS